MRHFVSALLLLLLAGCVSAGSASGPLGDLSGSSLSGKYDGSDGGYLVMTVAAQNKTHYTDYFFDIRRRDRSEDGRIWWGQGNPWDQRKSDIDDSGETGIVDVRRLPPGDYEIYNFSIGLNGGTVQSSWSAKHDFSIPFTIAPGAGTYIGEIMAVEIDGRNLFGMRMPNGAYFVLADKSERDLPIAKAKEPRLANVTIAVTDPSTLGTPLFRKTAEKPPG